MSQVPNIEGTPDPRQSQQLGKDTEIDAEKFKKIMKVDESEESHKRNKRQPAETEEELEESEEEKAAHASPAPGFSALLEEKDPKNSLFAPGAGKGPILSSSEGSAIGPTPFAVMSSRPVGETSKEVTKSDDSSDHTKGGGGHKTPQTKAKEEIKHEVKAPLKLEGQEKAFIPPKSTSPIEESAPVSLHKEAPIEEEKKALENMAPTMPPAPIETHRIDIEEEKLEVAKAETENMTRKDREKKEHKEEEQNQTVSPFTAPAPDIAPIKPIELPAYARLSPDVYELYERMIGLLSIEEFKGKTTTTVTLHMEGSIFHGSELIIEHYAAAPYSYNVQLLGSPQALAMFNDNFNDLAAAFQSSGRSFQVHLLRPALKKSYRATRVDERKEREAS